MESKTENILFIRHPASLIVLHLYSLNLSDEELADNLSSHSQFVRDDIKTALLYSNNNDLKNKFNLVERKCEFNTKTYKDVLIYRKKYHLTKLDNELIGKIMDAKHKYFFDHN